jgi:sulfur carrier protein
VKVIVNGEPRELVEGATVADLLAQFGPDGERRRGVAVAVDAEVVPRSAWRETELSDGQRVELLIAIQGG